MLKPWGEGLLLKQYLSFTKVLQLIHDTRSVSKDEMLRRVEQFLPLLAWIHGIYSLYSALCHVLFEWVCGEIMCVRSTCCFCWHFVYVVKWFWKVLGLNQITKQNLREIKWERFFSRAENFSAPPQIFIYMDFKLFIYNFQYSHSLSTR